ncbi:MAG TPA: lipocalin-like domain-containing protein [Bacteroidaceae bacterium]|nr:lipocalin-like domain-containing protein [Bacteroidaceae bacterium]
MGYIVKNRGVLKILLSFAIVLIIAICLLGCEPVFPNNKLDNFWRLNYVEYKSGLDFNGDVRKSDTLGDVYWGFARNIVQIENHSNGYFSYYGITTDTGDSIGLDFSVYTPGAGYDTIKIVKNLNRCGISGIKTSYYVQKIDRKSMILTNSSVILRFEKW